MTDDDPTDPDAGPQPGRRTPDRRTVVDHVRWRRTRHHLPPGRVELRTGLLISKHRSLHHDRIRTVDLTADPLLRAFGLGTARIGAGEPTGAGEGSVVLRAVPAAVGDGPRRELLDRAHRETPSDGVLGTLDPAWIRYAPTRRAVVALPAGARTGHAADPSRAGDHPVDLGAGVPPARGRTRGTTPCPVGRGGPGRGRGHRHGGDEAGREPLPS